MRPLFELALHWQAQEMDRNPERRPGEQIIDRYLPDADPETKERALENLRSYARALLRIAERQVREEREADSRKKAGRPIISATP